jgi:membrane-associated phospholipid phosphatase
MLRFLTWRALILFAIAALATFGFVYLAELVLEGRADATDRAVALAIHGIDTPVLDVVLIAFTQLGSTPMLVVAVTVGTIWLWRTGHRRTAIILVANAVASQVLMVALKLYIARPRPTLFDEITRPETFSFPSGHSMSAMAIYGAIAAVLITHHRNHRTLIVASAAVLIAMIGFSRIYLGVHWPFDVLAGFAAGVPLLVATVHLLHNRAKASAPPGQMNVYSAA